MQLIEWEVNEDGYEEQIIIPKEQAQWGKGPKGEICGFKIKQ